MIEVTLYGDGRREVRDLGDRPSDKGYPEMAKLIIDARNRSILCRKNLAESDERALPASVQKSDCKTSSNYWPF